jgi:hypothetical protein
MDRDTLAAVFGVHTSAVLSYPVADRLVEILVALYLLLVVMVVAKDPAVVCKMMVAAVAIVGTVDLAWIGLVDRVVVD